MGGDLPDRDEVMEVLSTDRRRAALVVLSDQQTELMLPDLAEEVAVRENDCPLTEISPEEVKAVYLDLYHAHIPRLVDLGAVDYHQERDMVTPKDDLNYLVAVVDAIDAIDPPNETDHRPR